MIIAVDGHNDDNVAHYDGYTSWRLHIMIVIL